MVAIKNQSTTITVDKTVGEIVGLLTRRGTTSVVTLYKEGQVSGLSFGLKTEYGPRTYALPVNADGVQAVLRKGGAPAAAQRPEQAARIAWRIAKEWLEVQIALVEAGLATLDEVLLPFMLNGGDDRTMYQVYRASALKELES
jgi:hypothetical protein